MSWLVDRGYKEDFVREQIVRASSLDRERLFNQEGRCNDKRKDQVPLVVAFHPALNELRGIVKKLYTMLEVPEEHWMAFKEQPLVVSRRVPNLKDNLVGAKLPRIQTERVRVFLGVVKRYIKFAVICQRVAILDIMFQVRSMIYKVPLIAIIKG